MKKTLAMVVLLGFAPTAGAQVIVHERSEKVAKEQQLQVLMEKTAGTAVHVSVETRPVIGAPYTAEAASESVQVLTDGNRIVRRSESRVYRDGKGRTRREELRPDGQVSSIAISDPANGTSFMFDPAENVAHRNRVVTFTSSAGVAGGTPSNKEITLTFSPDSKAHAELKTAQAENVTVTSRRRMGAADSAGTSSPATKQDLGEQVIEGVTTKGTRTTTVIPAGAIGNEQPITVTSEEWFSPDLKVLLMTKHADPRSGETTYRLTGITRGEPDPSLFELPAGVTIK
ncbi:MAG: hypothetical protein R6V57_03660 [Vicinamibacterales bacterium]